MTRSSRSSRTSSMTDDIDAITPCPLPQSPTQQHLVSHEPVDATHDFQSTRSTSPSSVFSSSSIPTGAPNGRRRESVKALEEGTNGNPERLWKRMLALQQIYGCYNSARMSAALSSGDAGLLLPSKACLDLMNEHMTLLPDEADASIEGHRSMAKNR